MDLFKAEVIVLSATQYSLADKQTGVLREGTSVKYLMTSSLAPCADGQQKGYKLAKASVGFNNFNDFPEVPGVYEVSLGFRISKDGMPIVDADRFIFKKSLTVK